MDTYKHSSTIDSHRCMATAKTNECRLDCENCGIRIHEQCKQEDVYGKESISRKRVDINGDRRRVIHLKFKWDAQEWREAVGRTIEARVRGAVALALCLLLLPPSHAAPALARYPRRTHSQVAVARGYLEKFGYLKQGQPEIENLLQGDASQYYEDDFRIAIKTLQEFGGLPVTGNIDEDTLHLMKQKRCGRPDRDIESEENLRRKKRFVVQGSKWPNTSLTWSLSSDRRPSNLDPGGTRQVLARALDVWEQASRLTFTEVNSNEANIVVSFAKRAHDDQYPFDGRGLILAHAFFPGTGRGGDVHFDDDEMWELLDVKEHEEGTSLFAVAAHEFGHSLGLSHSSVKGALMYPWYQEGIMPNFVLPEDDRNGIQQMYGPKEKRAWARIPNYRPVKTPPPTTTTTTTTTTTKRPYIHHHNRHPNHRNPHIHPSYTPGKYPVFYPDPRRYNTSEDIPRRTNPNLYPRPTPETTTLATTYRPRYPQARPEYPSYPRPNYPTDPRYDYPKKKPYYPEKTTTVRPTPPPDKPETCDTTYDAVALIRGELFIFKNRYHWRIGARGRYPEYPIEISRMWGGLPSNLTHVDAVYERPDRKIAFFVGRELYLFDTQTLLSGYPRPLTDLGLPQNLERIDAAMVWGYNGNTYLYSGRIYWKYDEQDGRVEPDYPRDMSMWKGVGYNIDSAFQWKDGKTYFFKGKGFWKFNDIQMRVEHERQVPSAPVWMGCPSERAGRRSHYHALPAPGSTLRSPSTGAAHNYTPQIFPLLVSLLSTLIIYLQYC